jgi:uncharacterized membrane protein YagU involved in acid resistance
VDVAFCLAIHLGNDDRFLVLSWANVSVSRGASMGITPEYACHAFFLPMVAGIATMLGFRVYYDHFSAFEEYFAVVWIDLMALVPAALGVLLEMSIFAIVVAMTRKESVVQSPTDAFPGFDRVNIN